MKEVKISLAIRKQNYQSVIVIPKDQIIMRSQTTAAVIKPARQHKEKISVNPSDDSENR